MSDPKLNSAGRLANLFATSKLTVLFMLACALLGLLAVTLTPREEEICAALGPEETRMVGQLILQLKAEGVGIFLISHDMHDVFSLSDRLAVMKNGKMVGTYRTADVTEDEVLGMIILGKKPEGKPETERPAR